MTHMPIAANLSVIQEMLAVVMPTCPAEISDRFLQLLSTPPAEITAQAKLLLNKPYGTNAILIPHGEYGLSFAQLLPKRSTSLHMHMLRREFFCVHHGVLTLVSGEETLIIDRLGCGFSTPNVSHMLANNSDEPLGVLEIFSPALLNDKVRLQDRYERLLGQVTFEQ
ncbi:hypothetical protein N8I74_01950 [Chitiniphilus purpureus]|uniref:Mannose-6-phosphate isomerase type II C-terminal domain-containing protein n=1 Tax=Chitiniphilus purpureus TaxID=2981137 RepID=A0ABY6DSC1_9NEIS|nr:hypothetical protein [Chitiniphilus sp. CD1]UXY17274.1 hypothetical protein N8I74_01950 [Chitiniphilus sp. CD1]